MPHDGKLNGAVFVAGDAGQPDRILSWTRHEVYLWDAGTQLELTPSVMVDKDVRNIRLIRRHDSEHLLVVDDNVLLFECIDWILK